MGRVILRRRMMRLLFLMSISVIVWAYSFWGSVWSRRIAVEKIAGFSGNRFIVDVGSVKGGIWNDMVLQDVSFKSREGADGPIFRLDRVEISYRLQRILAEKTGFIGQPERHLKSLKVFFSEKNPFVQGFISFYASHNSIKMIGSISLPVFGYEQPSGIKGFFKKTGPSEYKCDVDWGGDLRLSGKMDPDGKKLQLDFLQRENEHRLLKVEGDIRSDQVIRVYARLYNWKIFGAETVGDLWLSYSYDKMPLINIEAKNILVNKNPFRDISLSSRAVPDKNLVFFDKIIWGRDVYAKGRVSTLPGFPLNMDIHVRGLDIAELAGPGEGDDRLKGTVEAAVNLAGPIREPAVKGRVFIDNGILGELEFVSLFATLSGKIPVIKVTDARVVKDGGNITVSGEINISKLHSGHALDALHFTTDNKVAVWESWQISKEDSFDVVEAKKDRMTFTTTYFNDDGTGGFSGGDYEQGDLDFRYRIYGDENSQIEISETDDFLGLEHKVQF